MDVSKRFLFILAAVHAVLFYSFCSVFFVGSRIRLATTLAYLDPVEKFPQTVGFLGPTRTGSPPFLAQTDVATVKGTATDAVRLPIQTAVQSFDHKQGDRNIFELFGTISPYYTSHGWGVDEEPLPEQCKIRRVHLLSRHGTRYNTKDLPLVQRLQRHEFVGKNKLAFLNNWQYTQGLEILTSLGNEQLFDKGTRFFFRYGQLAPQDGRKLVARTTSQQRMTHSAKFFMLGFFGLDWQNKVNLDLLLEGPGFNNSLASYYMCPKDDHAARVADSERATNAFRDEYLASAVTRFNSDLSSGSFDAQDLLQLQELCTFEAVTLGYSQICSLFSQREWENYEYYRSWRWYKENFLGAGASARALGVSWVQEFRARLTRHPFDPATIGCQNSTLNGDKDHFPLDQNLNFDFTHDSIITNVFSALNLTQFTSDFTGDGHEQPFDISRVVPFASQTVFEEIECDGVEYVHMLLNDRTLPLHKNIAACEERTDGWCAKETFVAYLDGLYRDCDYENVCWNA